MRTRDKGKYNSCSMEAFWPIPYARLPRQIVDLSKEGKRRLEWFRWYREHRHNARLTCRHFGIHPSTFYKWLKRYDPKDLLSLEDESRRPYEVRKPETTRETEELVVKERKKHPYWSKYKLEVVLKKGYGVNISASTIGRILRRKKLIEHAKSEKRRKAWWGRKKKQRIKGEKIEQEPLSWIQMDTKVIYFPEGIRWYQFTAIDCITRKRVLRIYTTKSSRTGKMFLDECLREWGGKPKRIQTDNGSEFMGKFDRECERLGIRHFFKLPKDAPTDGVCREVAQDR